MILQFNDEQHLVDACAGDDGDEKVKRLMALGFDRQQCMEVLAACNGNEEHAASLLFEMGGGLGF